VRTWLAAALVLVLVLAAGALALLAATGPGDREVPPFPEVTIERDEPDPLEFEPGSEPDLTARAAAGHSHVVYALSPGGVHATARRVVRYRAKIERVARSAGVDPDLVEAMVFLESAGRPEVAASDDLEGAVGLGQILAGTATALLGMRVDVQASERLTRKIRRADARGRSARARRLRAARRRVDERFDPDKSLEGTGRYLRTARARFGREDLAVVSYHMGIGNLTGVLDAYGRRRPSWTRVYFDATPDRHPRTFRLLSELSDQSASYLWRVLASKEIMRLWREDRPELARLDALTAPRPRPRRCSIRAPRRRCSPVPTRSRRRTRRAGSSAFRMLRAGSACVATGAWASSCARSAGSTAACARRRSRSRPTWPPRCESSRAPAPR
jgi:hypothetical protein